MGIGKRVPIASMPIAYRIKNDLAGRDNLPPRLDGKWKREQRSNGRSRMPNPITTSRIDDFARSHSGYPGPQIWGELLLRRLLNFTCISRVPGFNQQNAVRLIGQAAFPSTLFLILTCDQRKGPPLVAGSSPVYAALGTSAVISCDIRGLPKPNEEKIHWRFQQVSGQPYPQMHESQIPKQKHRHNVQQYQKQSRQQVKVQSISLDSDSNQSGEHTPHWRLKKLEVPLGWISQLQIDRVETGHYGLYNCSASSSFGTGWHLFVLNQAPYEVHVSGQITLENLAQIFAVLLLISVVTVLVCLIWFRHRIRFRCHDFSCCPCRDRNKTSSSRFRFQFCESLDHTKSQTGFPIGPQSCHIVNRFDMEIGSDGPCVISNPMLSKYGENVSSKSVSNSTSPSPDCHTDRTKSKPVIRYDRSIKKKQLTLSECDHFAREMNPRSSTTNKTEAGSPVLVETDYLYRNPLSADPDVVGVEGDTLLLYSLPRSTQSYSAFPCPHRKHCLVSERQLSAPRFFKLIRSNQSVHPDERGLCNRVYSPHWSQRSHIADCSLASVEVNNACEQQNDKNIGD
ncbi:hypothetical protein FBUS_01370 [Fasciolopsis buskii]|uniref:Ig-like domain-containing protein n=1 Tax=Fasciolopsis buskii TaxID=27845 RepID=A0A8E0RU10_9TREM|nr:hypothetical protein FBUS_01370 [Fasciolopsis buski]